MTQKQKAKHIADRGLKLIRTVPFFVAAETTPDGLGTWEGGRAILKGVPNWIALKSHPTRTADAKNVPGKSSSEVVERPIDYLHGKKRDPHYTERTVVTNVLPTT
jgi:hypothetical protein